MTDIANWQYDEFEQVGKDYSLPAEAAQYDSRHADFRDVEKESNDTLDSLGIAKGHVLIDLGCGTGTFAIEAARRAATVYAVDVSEAMLEQAKEKAANAGVAGEWAALVRRRALECPHAIPAGLLLGL